MGTEMKSVMSLFLILVAACISLAAGGPVANAQPSETGVWAYGKVEVYGQVWRGQHDPILASFFDKKESSPNAQSFSGEVSGACTFPGDESSGSICLSAAASQSFAIEPIRASGPTTFSASGTADWSVIADQTLPVTVSSTLATDSYFGLELNLDRQYHYDLSGVVTRSSLDLWGANGENAHVESYDYPVPFHYIGTLFPGSHDLQADGGGTIYGASGSGNIRGNSKGTFYFVDKGNSKGTFYFVDKPECPH